MYSVPSLTLSTTSSVASFGALPADVHVARFMSRFSRTYPVIGEPPSLVGGFHLSVTELFVTSATSRDSGLPGTSVNG